MRYILILLLFISGAAMGQYAPTSAKTKFVNGLSIGSKDSTYFTNAGDTVVLYIGMDSAVYTRYKVFHRKLAFDGSLSSYKLIADSLFNNGYTTRIRTKLIADSLGSVISAADALKKNIADTFFTTGYTTRARTKQVIDSLGAVKVNYTDTATMLLPYARTSNLPSLAPYLLKADSLSGGYTTWNLTKKKVDSLGSLVNLKLNISDTAAMLSNYARKSGTAFTGGISGTSLSMSGSVTANTLIVNSNTANLGNINTSNATGGYLEWRTNGTTIADLGTATQIFGSGGSEVFSINARDARSLAFGTNNTSRFTIASDGAATFSSSVTANSFVKSGGTSSQFLKADGSVDNNTYLTTSDISGKLNISDTASMLSMYLRKTDTASLVLPYLRKTDTSSMLSSYARTSNLPSLAPYLLKADSLSGGYTTWNLTKKKVDSLGAVKLNVSDTATMLSNYRRKTTLIENSELRNSAITINGSSTSLGSSISVGTVTSVAASAGTGISVSGSPITTSGTLTITNTAPDQTVTLNNGTGISVTGTYPTFTITNTSPSSGGTVTSVATSAPITGGTITSTGTIGITQSTTSTDGYLSSTDWNTFNNKASTASVALKLNISDTSTMLSNYRRKTTLIENSDLRNSAITINGSSTSLGGSINVGTVTSVGLSVPTGFSVSNTPITSSGTIALGFTAGYALPTTAKQSEWDIAYNKRLSSANLSTSQLTLTLADASTVTASIPTWNQNTTGTAASLSGVLSSTLGGAGSVSGILKANGSGVVSAAVAGTDYVAPSALASYVPYTGATANVNLGSNAITAGAATLTGALNGTSAAFSGTGSFGNTISSTDGTIQTILSYGTGIGSVGTNTNHPLVFLANASEMARLVPSTGAFSVGGVGVPQGTLHVGNANSGIIVNESSNIAQIVGTNRAGTASAELFLKGFPLTFSGNGGGGAEQMRLTSAGRLLINTTTDNGTDALQVAGSVSVTSSVTANSFVKSGGTSSQFLKADGSVDGSTYLTSASITGKLNISDTASMLSNYRRTTTKITNSDLVNSTISGIALGSNLNSLSAGSGLIGTAYNGSSAQTFRVDTGRVATQIVTGGSLNKVRDSVVNLISATSASGSYTVSTSSLTNINSVTITTSNYIKVGDIVTVTIGGTLTPTTAGVVSSFAVSLPFTNSAGTQFYNGSGIYLNDFSVETPVSGMVTSVSTVGNFGFKPTTTNLGAFTFTFSYKTN